MKILLVCLIMLLGGLVGMYFDLGKGYEDPAAFWFLGVMTGFFSALVGLS